MIEFKKLNRPPPKLRDAYLDSLVEPQELYLEMHVEAGESWCLDDYAYAVVCDKKLVEFYIAPEVVNRAVEIFDAVITQSQISSVLAKSYDTQLLNVAFATQATVRTVGLLFRKITDKSFLPRKELAFRKGIFADADIVFEFNDDFFESIEEIREYASIGGLFILERDGVAIGCGIGKPVVDNRPDIDIGMLVSKEHRGNGYGGHIISFLKDHYLRLDKRPICGCSIDNVGSQRALENAGFVSEHRILEISY